MKIFDYAMDGLLKQLRDICTSLGIVSAQARTQTEMTLPLGVDELSTTQTDRTSFCGVVLDVLMRILRLEFFFGHLNTFVHRSGGRVKPAEGKLLSGGGDEKWEVSS